MASAISFFVANAVFEGRSERKRRSEGGAREVAAASFLLSSTRMRSTHSPPRTHSPHSSARPLFGALDGSKFRKLTEKRAVDGFGYNIGRGYRSGPEERKLGQLSTDESNRRSPPGSSFGLLEAKFAANL